MTRRSSTETLPIPSRCGLQTFSTFMPPIPRPPATRPGPTCQSSPCRVIRDSKADTWGTRYPHFPSGRYPASNGRHRCGHDRMAPMSCTTRRRRRSHSGALQSHLRLDVSRPPMAGRAQCASRGRPARTRQDRSSMSRRRPSCARFQREVRSTPACSSHLTARRGCFGRATGTAATCPRPSTPSSSRRTASRSSGPHILSSGRHRVGKGIWSRGPR